MMKLPRRVWDRLNYYTYRIMAMVDRLFFFFLNLLVRPRPRQDKILIIKVDAIGDYLLMRNFLPSIRDAFPKAQINYVCQYACQSLAETFDGGLINRFIYINRIRYGTKPFFRYRLLYRIRKAGFSMVLNPNFTRDIALDEPLVMAAAAPVTIGIDGELVRGKHNASSRRRADPFYSRMLNIPDEVWFEFERNRNFFAQALDHPHLADRLSIPVPELPASLQLPKRFVVLFPGAGAERRRWSPENFAVLADAVARQANIDIVICGSGAEKELAATIAATCQFARPIILSGQTNLPQLVAVLARSSMLVSNETSAVHMAAGLALPTVVISNANHFGRFTPYPARIFPECSTIYPPEVEDTLSQPDGWNQVVAKYGQHSTLNINLIPVQRVVDQVLSRLSIPSAQESVGQ